jgi:mRNA interferase RelE/StbE
MAGSEPCEAFELEWTEYSKKDYESLDGSQLVFVDKALARIQKLGMEAGTPLIENLIGCRKLKHRKLGLRVIFRQSKRGITIMQIVAIGARSDSATYRLAERRQ